MMEVVILYTDREINYRHRLNEDGEEIEPNDEPREYFVDIDKKDEKDQERTFGDIRKEFAAEMGLYEENFRLVAELTDEPVDDPAVILKAEDLWEQVSKPESESETDPSDKEADDLPSEGSPKRKESGESPADNSDEDKREAAAKLEVKDEAVEGEEEEVVPKVGEGGVFDEKGQLDSSEEEKSALRRKASLILNLVDRVMEQQSLDRNNVRNEIITVMRMSRDEAGLPMAGGRVPRAQRIRLRVQHGYPVFMVTHGDGTKHLACLAEDTVGLTRRRFAVLFKTPKEELVMTKEGEMDVLEEEDDNLTLGELGMEDGTAFSGSRMGETEVFVIFGFSICIKIKVSMTETIRKLKKQVARRAPDFKGVKFYMWYNGLRIRECDREEEDAPMGKIIMGLHFLRVMLELDPDLPVDVDPGPDMRAKRPVRDGRKRIIRRRRYPFGPDLGEGAEEEEYDDDEEGKGKPEEKDKDDKKKKKEGAKRSSEEDSDEKKKKKKKGGNGNGGGGNGGNGHGGGGNGGNGGSSESSAPAPGKVKPKPVRFDLNKRVLRYFSILVECQLPEDLDAGVGGDYNAPITLENLLPNMRLYKLRKLIEIHSKEKPENQSLFLNGTALTRRDDHKTLRELELDKACTLYMEPAINVTVLYGPEKTVEIRAAARSTTFESLALSVEEEAKIPREEIRLSKRVKDKNNKEAMWIPALEHFTFSEYKMQAGDVLRVERPFRVRAWHGCFLFDKLFWKNSSPENLKDWLYEETKIPQNKQWITVIEGARYDFKGKPTLGKSGLTKECEIEVFADDDLPPRLLGETAGGGQWVVSGNGDDDDDDDDPDYQEGAAAIGAVGRGNGAFAQFVTSKSDDSDADSDDYKEN